MNPNTFKNPYESKIKEWQTELDRLNTAFAKGPIMKTRSDGSVMPYYDGVFGVPIENQISALKKNLQYYSQGGAGYQDAYKDWQLNEASKTAPSLGLTAAQLVTNPELATNQEALAKYTGKTYNGVDYRVGTDAWKAGQATGQDFSLKTGGATGFAPVQEQGETAPKPFGLENITSTLNLGSQSTQVKELQKYLAANGYTGTDGKPLKEDGIYGPQTKAAVMQFQSKNGLVVDGVFGPKSLAKANNIATTSTQIDSAPPGSSAPGSTSDSTDPSNPNDGGTTYNTGDPAQDALLKELQDFIKAQQDAGLKLNEAINFDQATLDKFLETAKKQIHPFYQTQIDNIKADVLRTAPQILANYGSEVADAESKFQNTLGGARENYAGSGLAFSGQRGAGELGMQSTQDRSLAALNQGYGNKLYELGRGAEEKIGAGNMGGYNLGALANYSTNLSGKGGFDLNNLNTPYSPGGFKIGSLEYDREAATEARNQALKKTASESVVAGRSYQDLFLN